MKTVLITGANKGIGFACAKKFLSEGCRVILSGRSEENLLKAKARLSDERVKIHLWDIADAENAREAIETAHTLFGNIDTFINNAGIVRRLPTGPLSLLTETPETWDATMNTNLRGTFFALQAEAKYMIEKGIKGHIVNVCSEMGFRAARNAYGVSKWGVRSLTLGAAKMLADHGIVLNAVAPGETATEILGQKEGERVEINSPRGFRAMPEEIAASIFHLANDENAIGAIYLTDGGRSLY